MEMIGACHSSRLRGIKMGRNKSDVVDSEVITHADQIFDPRPRPLAWRLAVQVVAVDPSAALRMWLPCTAVAVDHFHLFSLGNEALTEARQSLCQQVKGRCGRCVDNAWASRRLSLRAGETLTGNAAHRLAEALAAHDQTGSLDAVWTVKEQLRVLLRSGSLAYVAAPEDNQHNPGNYKSSFLVRSAVRTAALPSSGNPLPHEAPTAIRTPTRR